jgi:carbon-monoxide dehydrogenase medium subunit
MIPPKFEYRRAGSAEEAVSLLAEYGDEAKILAGGHSLLPLMKLRLAQPEFLIDIGRVHELSYIRGEADHIAVGALTRYHDLEHSELLAAELPLLAHASGPSGVREIPASEFFVGPFETVLEPDELLTEIRLPRPASPGWSFQKLTSRAIDWAIVAVAVQGSSVGLVNMGSTPLRATATERALAEGASIADAAAQAAEGTSPFADRNASPDYRKHLARVLTRRGLEEAAGRAS